MQTVTLEEAKARPDELFGKVEAGEEVLITSQARPFARLLPVPGDNGHAPDPRERISTEPGVNQAGNGSSKSAATKANGDHACLFGFLEGKIEFLPGWDEPEDFGPDYR